MKRLNVWLNLILTAVCVVVFATACASSRDEVKTLVMATSADYPPYEFYDPTMEPGDPVGFDIDIAKYITSELGYELEIQDIAFKAIIPTLKASRADFAMAGLAPTNQRQKSVDFSKIYYEPTYTIVAPPGSNLQTYRDLVGKTVGVQSGSIPEYQVQEKAQTVKMTIQSRNQVSELIQGVKAGQLDAAMLEAAVAEGYRADNPDLAFMPLKTGKVSGSAIAFPKGAELRKDFNQVLTRMQENGKLNEFAARWFEADDEPQGD